MGKNRKFPYHSFYHENPHLKSPKIPPIPRHPRHGASKQGCKSAFGTLAAPLILFRHNRNGAVIALRIWMRENAVWAALERKKARA